MKKFIVIAFMALVSSAFADSRYVIVSHEGRDNSILTQPSYEMPEGKALLKSLKRVCASRFNRCEFWNENSQGVLVLCRFQEDKSAWVYVDECGKPLYIEGCRGGTFFNRIYLVEKPVKQPVVIQKEPQAIPQREYQEFYPEQRFDQPCTAPMYIEREMSCESRRPMFQSRDRCHQFRTQRSCNYGWQRPPEIRARARGPMQVRMNSSNCQPMPRTNNNCSSIMRQGGNSQFRGR